jgi:hypothetical protein
MPDENGNPTAAELTVARNRMGEHASYKLVEEVYRQGRVKYGTAQFDQNMRHVAEKVGNEKSFAMRDVLLNCDRPAELIQHLASNERELNDIAKVAHNPQRLAMNLAKIESRWNSGGYANTSEEPLWRTPSGRDKPGAADWSNGTAWDTATDKQLDEHLEARRGMKRQRGW